MKEALVLKSTGSWYAIQDKEGKIYRARTRGKMRLKGSKSTNPIAVGDQVSFELEEEPDLAIIQDVEERKNYIIRKSNNLSKQTQIIAANLDLAVLVVTLADPATSYGFIDRFLLTAEAYHIPVLLVFNKIDIYHEKENELLQAYEAIYGGIGYESLQISAIRGTHIRNLKAKLKGKTTLFSGHSGVGKSTLLNTIDPEVKQKTSAISTFSHKGKHTTTFAEMFEVEPGMRIIDTPGIKDFGVVDLEPKELAQYFPEMRGLMDQCKFNDCRHLEEPGCAVLEAVENGEVALSRYHSYLSMYHGEDMHH